MIDRHPERICKYCHKPFVQPNLGKGRPLEYCSERCRLFQRDAVYSLTHRDLETERKRARYNELRTLGATPEQALGAQSLRAFERLKNTLQSEKVSNIDK